MIGSDGESQTKILFLPKGDFCNKPSNCFRLLWTPSTCFVVAATRYKTDFFGILVTPKTLFDVCFRLSSVDFWVFFGQAQVQFLS